MAALVDWRDESNYPKRDNTQLPRWHWEFLRRNNEYQQNYKYYKKILNDSSAKKKRELLAQKYGLDGIMLDYSDPMESLFSSPRDITKTRLIQWQTSWVGLDEDGHMMEGITENTDYLNPHIRQHECCVIFNLRNLIDPQLDMAKDKIIKVQQRAVRKRGQVINYQYYLRLIDASDDGISDSKMAEYFFPEVEKKIGLNRIINDLKEAMRLRDIDYQYI